MLTDEFCTVYRFNGSGFDRYYGAPCHWQESKAANVLRSGEQSADGIMVYIPADALFFTPNNAIFSAADLYPNINTVHQNASKDIIVKGKCDFLFDNSSESSVSECFKQMKSQYEVHTIMSVDRLLYGSKELQHIKISAR